MTEWVVRSAWSWPTMTFRFARDWQACWKAPDSTSSGGPATSAAARTDPCKTAAGRDGVCAGGERGLNRALSARRLHRGCVGRPAVVCRETDTTGCGHAVALSLFAATSRGPRTFTPRWKASAPRALRTGLGRVPAQPGGAGTRGTLVGTESDVHLDVRLLWQWGKRDSPIVGRIADAAQIGRYVVWQCRSTNGP
jgi:hypothetical protein